MPTARRTSPFNQLEICLCCAGDILAKPFDEITYQERQTFTFIPRYHTPRHSFPTSVRYCPNCEAQRCPNMPGKNHYHTYKFVMLKTDSSMDLQFLQIGRVVNTVGTYRESFNNHI